VTKIFFQVTYSIALKTGLIKNNFNSLFFSRTLLKEKKL
jgi:hypothetical protein